MLKTLNYIHWQLGKLKVVDELPENDVCPKTLLNRMLDVKSAVLTYIAMHICHKGNPFGLADESSCSRI